ncbi:hypothetical protein GOBAR_DD32764 [Gossypium barbadense]|nr:hypothetical protein GOBAR_DD32764 [Gossypium barbadense]
MESPNDDKDNGVLSGSRFGGLSNNHGKESGELSGDVSDSNRRDDSGSKISTRMTRVLKVANKPRNHKERMLKSKGK